MWLTFERFDRDRSGRLDYREVKEALRAMGFDPSAKEAQHVVARYDRDRSGSLEFDEWAQLVADFRRFQERELTELRRELKGLAELREQLELARRAQAYPPDVRAIFERYDANHNGRLDHRELRTALHAFGKDGDTGC